MTGSAPARRVDRLRLGPDGTGVIGDRRLRITHPDRVVWPLTGTTKSDVIDYLLAVAPVLIPHLARRATMLWRFPEGVEGPGWFQAQCRSRPDWVPTYEVQGRRGDLLRYCLIEEPATLVWLANLGTLELHPHGWTIDRPAEPTSLIFDLDPGPPAGIPEAARVALIVADRLRAVGLTPIVKTSGGLGLHVAAPLVPGETFGRAKAFARSMAIEIEHERPGEVTASSDRSRRAARIYIDWIQNDRNRQLVAPYSPRAMPIPQVSTPLTWDEVGAAANGQIGSLRPGFDAVLDRLDRLGDLWSSEVGPAGSLPPTPAGAGDD